MFLGPAYLPRTAFTKGTEQEVDFLVAALGARARARVLDAGCGPGRHALALARRGFDVVGVDLSPDFIESGDVFGRPRSASPIARDSTSATCAHLSFDAGVRRGGLPVPGRLRPARWRRDEGAVLERFAAALRPGGRLAVSAFNAYFAVRHLEAGDTFDAAPGVNHERATLRDAEGTERDFDLWTTCFTPRN